MSLVLVAETHPLSQFYIVETISTGGKQNELDSLHNEEDDTRHAGGGIETGFIYPNLRPGDN